MKQFILNDILWNVRFIDNNNPVLIDRTGQMTLAVTDPLEKCIFLSEKLLDDLSGNLYGNLLYKVLIHELGHVVIFSYDLLPRLHSLVKKKYWVEAEEELCNFIVNYGYIIYEIANQILGNK